MGVYLGWLDLMVPLELFYHNIPSGLGHESLNLRLAVQVECISRDSSRYAQVPA
jgi:hypothetical protein